MLTFKAKAQDLAAALGKIERATETKTTIPALGCARLVSHENTIQICGSNLAMTLHTVVAAEVEVAGSGAAPVRLLLPLLRSLSGDVTVEVADSFHFKIKSKSGRYRVLGLDVEKYPPQPSMATSLTPVKGEDVLAVINRCEFAASLRDDNRFSLCGAKLEHGAEGFVMITADTHRMSVATAPCEAPFEPMFVTRLALPLIRTLCESGQVMIGQTDKSFTFASGTEILTVNKQTVTFPLWRTIMPEGRATRVAVETAALADALRRAITFSDKDSTKVVCAFEGAQVTLRSSSPESGECEDVIAAEIVGPPVTVAFNASYLLDFVSRASGERISWQLGTPDEGALLSEGSWRYALMPMMLNPPAKAAAAAAGSVPAEAITVGA